MTAEEIYSDEDSTYWIVAGGRTAEEARRVIATVCGYTLDMLEATPVFGKESTKDGSPWFEEVPEAESDVGYWRIDVTEDTPGEQDEVMA